MQISLDALWDAANSDEDLHTLQRLLVQAGILWRCPECGAVCDPKVSSICEFDGTPIPQLHQSDDGDVVSHVHAFDLPEVKIFLKVLIAQRNELQEQNERLRAKVLAAHKARIQAQNPGIDMDMVSHSLSLSLDYDLLASDEADELAAWMKAAKATGEQMWKDDPNEP